MVFPDAPATLDSVVLAVVWRIVSQLDHQSESIRKLDQSLHELGSVAGNFGTVIEIDQQFAYLGVHGLTVSPPEFQTICHKVARIAGRAEDHVQLMVVDFQNASGCQYRIRMHVVIDGLHGLFAASCATA